MLQLEIPKRNDKAIRMSINYLISNENMIDKVFCQCISDNMTEMDQCMRINCPCEQTDCALHNDN